MKSKADKRAGFLLENNSPEVVKSATRVKAGSPPTSGALFSLREKIAEKVKKELEKKLARRRLHSIFIK